MMRQKMNRGEIEQKEQGVGHVELPNAPKKTRGPYQESTLHHHSSENQCRRVSGNEHEQIGSVTETVISRREPGEHSVGNVTQENGPVGQAPEKVKPQISFR